MTQVYVMWGAKDELLKEVADELFGGEEMEVEFLVGDAREELEQMPEKLAQKNLELARVIAVVDAAELEKRKELRAWWEMLAHFADVMLLTRTREVSPAWMNALKKTLKDRPMLMFEWPEALKKNPQALKEQIIYPEARRLTQIFETDEAADVPVFEGEIDGEEEEPEEVDELDEIPAEKYFERDAAGRYKVKVTTP